MKAKMKMFFAGALVAIMEAALINGEMHYRKLHAVPDRPLIRDPHARIGLKLVSPNRAEYACVCGKVGYAKRSYPGEDLLAKAERNHTKHWEYHTPEDYGGYEPWGQDLYTRPRPEHWND